MTTMQFTALVLAGSVLLLVILWAFVLDYRDSQARWRKQHMRDLTIGRDQHRAEQLAKLADWQRPAAKGFVAQRKINGGDGHGKTP